jgi:hypothetical protein
VIVQEKQLRGLDVITKTQDKRVRRRMGRSEDAGFMPGSRDLQHHVDHYARFTRPGRSADEVRCRTGGRAGTETCR